MNILNFTVEEINMIAIFKMESRTKTIFRMHDVYQLMNEDMQEIASTAARKLSALTDAEFELIKFVHTDDDIGGD